MTRSPLAAVVMAAGLGTRMRSATPKHLHPLLGGRLVDWVIAAARPLDPDPLVLVTSPEAAPAFAEEDGLDVVVQSDPRGTGDAVATARETLSNTSGDVLVLSGDTPLLTTELLLALVEEHRQTAAAVTVLSLVPPEPGAYGRVLRDDAGRLAAIVEAKDASPEELAIHEVNSSIYVFGADALWPAIDSLDAHNAQGELYLTDCVRTIVDEGLPGAVLVAPDWASAAGVNTRAELAGAAAVLRDRINEVHMLSGVTIVDPRSTWIEAGVEIAPDTVVHPFSVLRGATRVGTGAEVGPHAVVWDAEIGEGALVGPFTYLRPGTVLEAGSKAGAFVEIKNSRIGARTKVPHLSYIGDADIGEDSNIGAGAITANLPHEPGSGKQRTTIGRNVRTGVDNAFIAPVTIGDNAWVAAGSVITDDVPADALAIARPRQENKKGRARGHRND
jgi:bifunctional UDP-N-acetylglucosamine pyrophosphorylase / glucosamine-1-phosphate N-acetyltransferase